MRFLEAYFATVTSVLRSKRKNAMAQGAVRTRSVLPVPQSPSTDMIMRRRISSVASSKVVPSRLFGVVGSAMSFLSNPAAIPGVVLHHLPRLLDLAVGKVELPTLHLRPRAAVVAHHKEGA